MMGDYGDGWWSWMLVGMAVIWLIIPAGVGWLVWHAHRARRSPPGVDEILKQRLARGEIDPEQYHALKQDLDSTGGTFRRGSGGRQGTTAFVAIVAALLLVVPAIAATRADWDLFDRMGRMMGGDGNSADAPVTTGGPTETVEIGNFAFSPGNLRVPVGAVVTWTNRDSAPHDATSTDGSWQTETLRQGRSGSLTFDRAGEYNYYCTIHPSMRARLSVE